MSRSPTTSTRAPARCGCCAAPAAETSPCSPAGTAPRSRPAGASSSPAPAPGGNRGTCEPWSRSRTRRRPGPWNRSTGPGACSCSRAGPGLARRSSSSPAAASKRCPARSRGWPWPSAHTPARIPSWRFSPMATSSTSVPRRYLPPARRSRVPASAGPRRHQPVRGRAAAGSHRAEPGDPGSVSTARSLPTPRTDRAERTERRPPGHRGRRLGSRSGTGSRPVRVLPRTTGSRKWNPGVTSENTVRDSSRTRQSTSENTGVPSEPKRRGAQPTALPREYADFLAAYTGALADVPLAADTKRTYVSRVRMYLAWLASPAASRRSQGDPLVSPRARDWAVRDYRFYLLRDADPKRSIRYSNNALAALDDFHVRLGLGKADIGRDDLPKTAPRALDGNAQIRWLRAVEDWPHARDRLRGLLPFYAGLRVGDAVALDVPDVRMSARKGVLVVYGKGGKIREVPIHPRLRDPLTLWLGERPQWKHASDRALFLNRPRGRASAP